jgi:hypothetical protein
MYNAEVCANRAYDICRHVYTQLYITMPISSETKNVFTIFPITKNMRESMLQISHFRATSVLCRAYVTINWTVLFYLLLF